MKPVFDSAEAVLAAVGKPLGTSEWLTITQERIKLFADATDDHQWIHVDPVRAAKGPFGACIAHGYLTLSLISRFLPEMFEVRNMKMGVNYGSDKVRYTNAVKAGARVRAKGELAAAEKNKDGSIQATARVTIEIENESRPACVADVISRYYF